MKKLLVISFTDISKDVRILRHLETLKEDFEINTCSYGVNPKHSKFHFQIPIKLNYLPINLKALVTNRLKLYRFSYQSTPAIAWALGNLAKTIHSYDALLCNDVLTSGIPTLLDFKGLTVLDMHEYAPLEMEDDWKFRIFLQKYYFWLCKQYLKKFNKVVTVSQGIAKKYLDEFDVKCEIILNACKYEIMKPSRQTEGKIRIVHSGLALKNRKLHLMIESCSKIDNVIFDLFLVPASREKREYYRLKDLASKTNNCRVLEPVHPELLVSTLNKYDVGLYFLDRGNFNNENCLPNKLFDFLQARLMIIVSPLQELSYLVQKYKLGRVTEDFSVESLQRELRSLSHEEIKKYKENADKISAKINLESEAKKLKRILESCI